MSSTPINNGDSGLTARNAINANFLDHDNSLANLSNVDNTSDLDKPVSTAQQASSIVNALIFG